MDLPELRRKKIKDFHFLAKFKFYAKNCKGLIISNLHSCIKIISKHTICLKTKIVILLLRCARDGAVCLSSPEMQWLEELAFRKRVATARYGAQKMNGINIENLTFY